MSGEPTNDRTSDTPERIYEPATDAVNPVDHGTAQVTRGFRGDARTEIDEANEIASEALSRSESGKQDAASKAERGVEDFSDKISDALNEAGEKFGGLIDKARSVFDDQRNKR